MTGIVPALFAATASRARWDGPATPTPGTCTYVGRIHRVMRGADRVVTPG